MEFLPNLSRSVESICNKSTICNCSTKNNEENNRMLDAKDYLESQGKLSDSVELYNKINDRWLKINKYREGRYFELNKTLKEEEKKETKRVKEKAQEMEDQYSR